MVASHWQRERENRQYPRCYIQERSSFREFTLIPLGRLEELAAEIVQEINTLGKLFFRHFQPSTISAEESESEKHKCVDTNTSQGVPINNPGVLIHYADIGKIKQQGCSICVSSILLRHSQIFIFGYFLPLINPAWLEFSVLVCALCPRACHMLLKIPELSV